MTHGLRVFSAHSARTTLDAQCEGCLKFDWTLAPKKTTRPECLQTRWSNRISLRWLAPEQRQEDDDRQRNADQPQQRTFAPGHGSSPEYPPRYEHNGLIIEEVPSK
jgi:hypothetical protein